MLSRKILGYRFYLTATILYVLGMVLLGVPHFIVRANAEEGGGTLVIHSSWRTETSGPGMVGHSWIEYTPDGGDTVTYGSWPSRGVVEDEEKGWSSDPSRSDDIKSRSKPIDAEQEQALMDYINSQKALGAEAHTLLHNCSSFASEAWEEATSENISPGWIDNPTTLRKNIENANTGSGGGGSGGVGGGGGGGVESGPLDRAPSSFLDQNGLGWKSALALDPPLPPKVRLEDVIPTEEPNNTTAVQVAPDSASSLPEVVDAIAIDFIDNDNGLTTAVVLGLETIERPHEHDYTVCSRFHGYSIENLAPIPFPDLLLEAPENDTPWFWYTLALRDEVLEEAFLFAVFVNESEREFIIDSRPLVDCYPEEFGIDFNYIFNFQIWSSSSEEAYKLLHQIVKRLANFEGSIWTVVFANTVEPPSPSVIISQVEYYNNEAKLTIYSWLTDTQVVTLFGSWRSYSDWNTSIEFSQDVEIPPGTSVVTLPFENFLDAVLYSNVDGFLSKVYVGSGFWFAFEDSVSGGASQVSLTLPECADANNLISSDLAMSGWAQIVGEVANKGWVGLGRTLNPNGFPIDVSNYQALTFFARGDGKSYRVLVETDSVMQAGSTDYHQFVFTTSPEWRQYVIPLPSFSQQGWDPNNPVAFTGEDVKAVIWMTVGGPHDSIGLEIAGAAFVNSTIISGTTVLPHTTDETGPYTINAQIEDDLGVQSACLFYSIDDGQTFTSVPMDANEVTFSVSIPGQVLGTEVRYYIEATDANDNVATDPVDIPYTTYRFQISKVPYLLVDDFADTNPANQLGGNSWLFEDGSGGSILAHYDKESMKLEYDVSTPDSYAGYSAFLGQVDLRFQSAVTLLIKGDAGGEKVKVGLRDSSGNEPKIVISEYLPSGVTNAWQKVTIPLVAFIGIADWSSVERFVIVCEHRIGSGEGAVYLDDLKFEQIPFVCISVDNFNDMTGENGLGGSFWSTGSGGATIDTAYDQANAYGDIGSSYRISYSGVTGTAWAAVGTDLIGLDASMAQTLSFYIKGANGGERPNIYLASRTGETETWRFKDLEEYITVAEYWKRADIPLEDFVAQGVDLANLAYFQVVFEWEEMTGTIYLDDIQIGSIIGDIDWDCDVDLSDFARIADRWKAGIRSRDYVSVCDLNHDDNIDLHDIVVFAAHWCDVCP